MTILSRAEKKQIIRNCILLCAKEDGWTNLAELGAKLRERGLRYGKLSRFIQDFPRLVEMRMDYSLNPPRAYARLREEAQVPSSSNNLETFSQ